MTPHIDSLHNNNDDENRHRTPTKTSIVFGADGGGGDNNNDDDDDGISLIGDDDDEEEEATGTVGSQHTLDTGSPNNGCGGCFSRQRSVGQPLGFLRLSVVLILMTTAVAIVAVVAYLSVQAERHEMNFQYEALSGLVLGTYTK
jgi:hypothetical protein